MKRKLLISIPMIALTLLLTACVVQVEQPGPAPAAETAPPEPVAEQSPEPEIPEELLPGEPPVTGISLAGMDSADLLTVAGMTDVIRIDTEGCEDYDLILGLYYALPDCEIHWTYEIQGEEYTDETEELVLSYPEGLLEGLRYLPSVKKVDLIEWDTDFKVIDELIEAYPDVDFIFDFKLYKNIIRSDITCFSTLIGTNSLQYTSQTISPVLRYCRHLKALDVGHNKLTDLTELGKLTELKVLIIADNRGMTDLSPLANLKDLEYLELFVFYRDVDFSFLNSLTKMKYLNLSWVTGIDSFDFTDNMPDLKMFWAVGNSKVSNDDKRAFMEEHPEMEAHLICYDNDSTCHNWRKNDVNYSVRTAFANWQNVVDIIELDDIVYKPDAVLKKPAG